MRRWEYLYNSTWTNCSKLNLALVSMHLLNSVFLDKGIQQGSPSVCIWHSMLLKRKIPHDLDINFLLYWLLCWFILLRKSELCLYCRWFWAVHITSEHQGQGSTKALVQWDNSCENISLLLPKLLSPFSHINLLHCLYTRGKKHCWPVYS